MAVVITADDLKRKRPPGYIPGDSLGTGEWQVWHGNVHVGTVYPAAANSWAWSLLDGTAKSRGGFGDPDTLHEAMEQLARALTRRANESEGLRVTRQAIERAVERSDGSNDDRILRAVDPTLAAALDALPVGWEVGHYTQQQQAAARAFQLTVDSIEGVQIMSETEAVVAVEIVDEQAAAAAIEKERQAPFVAKVVDRLGFMLANQQELTYLPERDGFIVDMGNGDGVRILAYHQQFYESDYRKLATQTATRLRHTLSAWTFSGDRENIGEIVRCTACGDLGSLTTKGKRNGAVFTSRCIGAVGEPGSLAGVKAHMDLAGEPPSTEWTRNDDSRR